MQRILHIFGKMDRAGAETMIMNIFRKIDRSKIQFDFLVFTADKGDYDDEIELLGGKIYRVVASGLVKRMFALRKFFAMHPEFKVVHSHTLLSSAFHLMTARYAGIPHRIAHSHSTNNTSGNRFVSKAYKNISCKIIEAFSTYKIACGAAASAFLFPYSRNVRTLPNAVDIEMLAQTGRHYTDYLDKYRIKNDIIILQVGRLEEMKNHRFSLELAKHMKEKGYSFQMLFVGQGSLEKTLGDLIRSAGLDDVCVMLGLRTDIPQLMAGADVMLMPSHHEGFPVVLVESQAVGLPAVISTNIAAEVDLGAGYIKFLSLSASLHEWSTELVHVARDRGNSAENRIEALKGAGFDVQNNADILTELYLSMK